MILHINVFAAWSILRYLRKFCCTLVVAKDSGTFLRRIRIQILEQFFQPKTFLARWRKGYIPPRLWIRPLYASCFAMSPPWNKNILPAIKQRSSFFSPHLRSLLFSGFPPWRIRFSYLAFLVGIWRFFLLLPSESYWIICKSTCNIHCVWDVRASTLIDIEEATNCFLVRLFHLFSFSPQGIVP